LFMIAANVSPAETCDQSSLRYHEWNSAQRSSLAGPTPSGAAPVPPGAGALLESSAPASKAPSATLGALLGAVADPSQNSAPRLAYELGKSGNALAFAFAHYGCASQP
jgi:hypothetical protein